MDWNWQHPDWPEFTWDAVRLARAEEQFLVGGGVLLGTVSHLCLADKEQLTIDTMSVEAVTTSEIEGEILDRASVQSSIRRQLGLGTDRQRVKPAEAGIAEMMVDIHRTFAEPLSDDMLFRWHRMLLADRQDIKEIGRYRSHADPMQVVSGPLHAPKVHYEAPPSETMPMEMARFVDWFNDTAPGGATPLPALTRAGLAHFYFVCVHPFEDGNGRIGRAIAEKALAQSIGAPTLIALAATILAKRKGYYDVLEQNNTRVELTGLLTWFSETVLEAQRRALATVNFLIDKTRLLDRVGSELNERQMKVLLRMFDEGIDGFRGGLSARNYMTIAGATTATASRDLADMVAKGALTREGERRHARYNLSVTARAVGAMWIDGDGQLQQ